MSILSASSTSTSTSSSTSSTGSSISISYDECVVATTVAGGCGGGGGGNGSRSSLLSTKSTAATTNTTELTKSTAGTTTTTKGVGGGGRTNMINTRKKTKFSNLLLFLVVLFILIVLLPTERNSMIDNRLVITYTTQQQQQQQQEQTEVILVENHGKNQTNLSNNHNTISNSNNNSNSSHSLFQKRIQEYFRNTNNNDIDNNINVDIDNNIDIDWIHKYVLWHDEQRQLYPESLLFTHPNAPNITIGYFDPTIHHGGLTDRMKGIGHLLRKCHDEQRLLLLVWYSSSSTSSSTSNSSSITDTDTDTDTDHDTTERTFPLESFLIPNLFNWTVPYHESVATGQQLQSSYGNNNNNNDDNHNIHQQKKKIEWIRFTNQLGNWYHPFGIIWNVFFQPSPIVARELQNAISTYNLQPFQYDAVHCRIGHPAFRNEKQYNTKQKQQDITTGYNFQGINRIKAIQSATHAIQCANWLAITTTTSSNNNNNHTATASASATTTTMVPLYFYSDSSDLIQTVIHPYSLNTRGDVNQIHAIEQLVNATKQRNNINENNMYNRFTTTSSSTLSFNESTTTDSTAAMIVGRTNVPIAHLERRHHQEDGKTSKTSTSTKQKRQQQQRQIQESKATTTSSSSNNIDNDINNDVLFQAHVNTFVDLYIAIQARCITMGVGRFAYMAAKISGTKCWIRHSTTTSSSSLLSSSVDDAVSMQWGMTQMNKEVPSCPI